LKRLPAQKTADQANNPTSGMSSAEKRLSGILDGLEGADGAALLGAGAFGQFSEDNMNALLSNAGVSALTGVAAEVAAAYADELQRNVDVSGLQFYVDALTSGGIDLAALADQLASSTEAITGVIPGFAIPGVSTGGGSSSGGSSGGTSNPEPEVIPGQNPDRPSDFVANLFGSNGIPWDQGDYNYWSALLDGAYKYKPRSEFVDAFEDALGDQYGEVPSYAKGTNYHPGGPAITHPNELITVPNMPRGTSVTTAGEVAEMNKILKAQLEEAKETNARMREQFSEIRRQGNLERQKYSDADPEATVLVI